MEQGGKFSHQKKLPIQPSMTQKLVCVDMFVINMYIEFVVPRGSRKLIFMFWEQFTVIRSDSNVITYLDLGFVWSLCGFLDFASLLFPLSICLHDTTEESTLVLRTNTQPTHNRSQHTAEVNTHTTNTHT